MALESTPIGLVLENAGLGPARVHRIALYLNGKRDAELLDRDVWDRALNRLGANGPFVRYRWLDESGEILKAGQSVTLLSIQKEYFTGPMRDRFEEALRSIEILVCYCSLYDECRHYHSQPSISRSDEISSCRRASWDIGP